MTRGWGLAYEIGIWAGGGFMILSLFISWARYLKRWWGREQAIREYEYEQRKRDAHDDV